MAAPCLTARSLAQGTLRLRVLRPGKEHDDEAWRIYDRDRARYLEHFERSVVLPPTRCSIYMAMPQSGLGGPQSAELLDLLYYLKDAIEHYRHSWQTDNKGRVVPPQTTRQTRWHCSMRSQWMITSEIDEAFEEGGRLGGLPTAE